MNIITHQKIQEKIIKELADVGLNLFAVKEIAHLSFENRKYFNKYENKNSKIILIGAGGRKLWSSVSEPKILEKNPIDSFCKSKATNIRSLLNSKGSVFDILFPNEVFSYPLLSLSRELGLSQKTPINIDISREYGLWFSIRLVIIADSPDFVETKLSKFVSPCLDCTRPCETACNPRLSCPYHSNHQYDKEQINYHHQASMILAGSRK